LPESPASSDQPYREGLPAVFDVVKSLRAPDGCPWDREQTHESLRQYLLEETYEVLEAIDTGDDAKLKEELGDLLLQVAMHAEIAEQEGRFDAAALSEQAAVKMVSRHPHVFGTDQVADAEEVLRHWEDRKGREAHAAGRVEETPLDRVPASMPALAWALGLQKRAARVGFDYDDPRSAAEGVAEEARELAAAEAPAEVFDEVGDLLFAVVNLARKLKVNPEDALRVSGRRFRERYKVMDRRLRESGRNYREMSADELEAAWAATGAPAPD
jgi:tetrapyrrole methylase family protein / MazG family protein